MMYQAIEIIRLRLFFAFFVMIGVGVALSACDLLDVNNPNDLVEEDLENPTIANALVNGSIVTTSRAYSYAYALHGTATDELTWIGSFDAWNEIDFGFIDNPLNQFVEEAFPYIGEARYTATNAIRRIEGFRQEGTLDDELTLARAYHYGALAYLLIGDMFENFAFSNKTEPVEPVGEENMHVFYDSALVYLDNAIQIARAEDAGEIEAMALATRARAKHGRVVWQMLNPPGSIPEDPYVGNESAVADAEAYLEIVGSQEDEEFQLLFGSGSVSSYVASQVNDRQEIAVTDTYTELVDPVTNRPDPRTEALVSRFTESQYAPITYVSTREIHLILAEAALASNDKDEAVAKINEVRELGGLESYNPDNSNLSVAEMLKYERKANLFMTGRRLQDLYRFGEEVDKWQPNAATVQVPGTVFPVSNAEREANPHFD